MTILIACLVIFGAGCYALGYIHGDAAIVKPRLTPPATRE